MNAKTPNKTQAGMAQGMSNIYDDVSTSVASAIKQELVEHFGQGLYYRMKNGEKPISPEQQAYIIETFTKHGATTPPVFDKML